IPSLYLPLRNGNNQERQKKKVKLEAKYCAIRSQTSVEENKRAPVRDPQSFPGACCRVRRMKSRSFSLTRGFASGVSRNHKYHVHAHTTPTAPRITKL